MNSIQVNIDLIIFFISHLILLIWCVLVLKNKTKKTLFLNLSSTQIFTLLIMEIILFLLMYFNFESHKSSYIADSFAWHYSLVYARGVLPIIGLSSINDSLFNFDNPILLCLISCLTMDYIILFIFTQISKIKSWSKLLKNQKY